MKYNSNNMIKFKDIGNNQRGSILIMVLWILSLLAIIISYYSSEVKILNNVSRYDITTLASRQIALSILKIVSKHLVPDTNGLSLDDEPSLVPNQWYSTSIGSFKVSFKVENEAGKIDLIRTEEGLLRDFLRFLMDEENPIRADTICDSILDWQDNDKLERINGAEDSFYKEKLPPYKAANQKITTLNELLLIRGVNKKLFFGPITGKDNNIIWQGGLRDIFTIYNDQKTVNIDLAPTPVKEFFSQQTVTATEGYSKTWLLKMRLLNKEYRIYWQWINKKRFKILYWEEGYINSDDFF